MFSVIYGLRWLRVLIMETVQSCMAHGKAIPGRRLHCGAPGHQKATMVNLAHVKKVLHISVWVSLPFMKSPNFSFTQTTGILFLFMLHTGVDVAVTHKSAATPVAPSPTGAEEPD